MLMPFHHLLTLFSNTQDGEGNLAYIRSKADHVKWEKETWVTARFANHSW